MHIITCSCTCTLQVYLHLQQVYKKAVEHLEHAKTERKHYQAACEKSKTTVETIYKKKTDNIPPPNCCINPCSITGTIHYSFDFAQQVSYNLIIFE